MLRYPEIADALADGRLCVSTLAEIRKVITPANAAEILPRFFHRSAREAKEVAAAIAPDTAPPRQDVITKVRPGSRPLSLVPTDAKVGMVAVEAADVTANRDEVAAATASRSQLARESEDATDSAMPLRVQTSEPAAHLTPSALPPTVIPEPDPARRDDLQPLTADLYRAHITVTKRWVEKLEAAKCALSHSIPSGSAEEVIEAAFDALLEREAKRRGLQVSGAKLRESRAPFRDGTGQRDTAADADKATPATRVAPKQQRPPISARVRREVWKRDQAMCQARLHDRTVCGSKVRLQLDHVVPVALGGASTTDNLRILCSAHNQVAAWRALGEPFMDLFG